jgi:hypothetical protein
LHLEPLAVNRLERVTAGSPFGFALSAGVTAAGDPLSRLIAALAGKLEGDRYKPSPSKSFRGRSVGLVLRSRTSVSRMGVTAPSVTQIVGVTVQRRVLLPP